MCIECKTLARNNELIVHVHHKDVSYTAEMSSLHKWLLEIGLILYMPCTLLSVQADGMETTIKHQRIPNGFEFMQ